MSPSRQTSTSDQKTACYIYGVIPADVELTDDNRGLAGHEVLLVRHGDIAALVSEIDVTEAIGRPEDLAAHEQVLDATVTACPILPFRFGAVMTDQDTVAEELLAANHDEFVAALKELEGKAEYIVKGRYDEAAILQEVLAENGEAANLRDQMRDKPEDATRDLRIRLGEIIHEALSAKRNADTEALAQALDSLSAAKSVLEQAHEYEAVNLAFLIETSRQSEFEQAVADFAGEQEDRIEFRLLGPLAPYDFVIVQK